MTRRIELTQDLKTCFALRYEVFVLEQSVPLDEEQDGLDKEAQHFLATLEELPVGTARILRKGETGKIGRVCVLQHARGQGLGADLIKACLAYLKTVDGIARAQLGAQIQAVDFYRNLGFEAFGDVYLDAGIEHIDMVRDL